MVVKVIKVIKDVKDVKDFKVLKVFMSPPRWRLSQSNVVAWERDPPAPPRRRLSIVSQRWRLSQSASGRWR